MRRLQSIVKWIVGHRVLSFVVMGVAYCLIVVVGTQLSGSKHIPIPPLVADNVAPKHPEVTQRQDDPWKTYDPPQRVDRPLLPASDADPQHHCNQLAPVDATKVYVGDWMGWIKKLQEMTVLKVGNVDLIRLKKVGSLAYLSAVFMDERGDILAKIHDNRFELNLDQTYSIQRPDDHEMIILHKDRRLLQVRYINRGSLRIAGSFKVPGYPMIEVASDKILVDGKELGVHGMCAGECEIGVQF